MSYSDTLRSILKDQENLRENLQELISQMGKDDQLNRSEKQEKDLQELRDSNEKMKERLENLEGKNQELQLALMQLAAAEKNRILGLSKRGREVYFRKRNSPIKQQLATLEKEMDRRIERFQNKQYLELGEKRSLLLQEVEEYSRRLQESLGNIRRDIQEKQQDFQGKITDEFQFLEKEPVTEKQLERRIKRNQWEMKIGLKWLNKAGIILVLISVGFLAYYARNSYTQAALITLLGGLFLGAAELFYRRGRLIFAQSLMGGGVGILYSGVFFSHFVLQVGGQPLVGRTGALLLVLLVTLFTLLLAWFRNSETILSLGLVGGYLPFLATLMESGFSGTPVYLAMFYLLLINLAVLVLSFFRKWRSTGWLSFLLNTPAMIYLILRSPSKGIALVYIFILFFLYLAVVLVPRFRLSRSLILWDVLLLAANSLSTAVLSFYLVREGESPIFRSLLALSFALLYFFLARRLQVKGQKQTGEFLLFAGTSLAFALWLIPLLFGLRSMTLGFLLETLVLIVLGHRRQYPHLEKAGWAAYWGTLASLLFWALLSMEPFRDFLRSSGDPPVLFTQLLEAARLRVGQKIHWNLILFTLGSLGISLQYTPWLNKQGDTGGKEASRLRSFRYGTLILVYLTLMGEMEFFLRGIQNLLSLPAGSRDSLIVIVLSLLSLGYSLILLNLPAWRDRITRIFGLFALALGELFWLLFLLDLPGHAGVLRNFDFRVLAPVFAAALYNGLILWQGGDLIRREVVRNRGSQGRFPLLFSLFILLNTALFILRFLPVETPALIYGFAYLLASWILIWRGFRKAFPPLRILGLVTLFVSLLILLYPILRQAEPIFRIISFLVYGLLMLGISLIYQNISIKRGKNED